MLKRGGFIWTLWVPGDRPARGGRWRGCGVDPGPEGWHRARRHRQSARSPAIPSTACRHADLEHRRLDGGRRRDLANDCLSRHPVHGRSRAELRQPSGLSGRATGRYPRGHRRSTALAPGDAALDRQCRSVARRPDADPPRGPLGSARLHVCDGSRIGVGYPGLAGGHCRCRTVSRAVPCRDVQRNRLQHRSGGRTPHSVGSSSRALGQGRPSS